MTTRHPKKKHPHNLPHLSDASTDAEVLSGAALWAKQVQDGAYTFVVKEEHAINEDLDVMLVVRERVKK